MDPLHMQRGHNALLWHHRIATGAFVVEIKQFQSIQGFGRNDSCWADSAPQSRDHVHSHRFKGYVHPERLYDQKRATWLLLQVPLPRGWNEIRLPGPGCDEFIMNAALYRSLAHVVGIQPGKGSMRCHSNNHSYGIMSGLGRARMGTG